MHKKISQSNLHVKKYTTFQGKKTMAKFAVMTSKLIAVNYNQASQNNNIKQLLQMVQ